MVTSSSEVDLEPVTRNKNHQKAEISSSHGDVCILTPGRWEEFAGAAPALDESVRVEEAFPLEAPLWLPGLFFPELIIWGG